MKHAFEKQITVGLLATMLVASPVFAETTTTVSEPIGLKKRPVSTTSKKEDVPPAQGSGAAGTAARFPARVSVCGAKQKVSWLRILIKRLRKSVWKEM